MDRSALNRTVVVHTGKGGSKKTSLVTNVAGVVAAAGYAVLLVDTDRQGNAGEDLGYTGKADDGLGLVRSLTTGAPLTPTLTARKNLDVVAGGPELDELVIPAGQNPGDTLAICLAPLAESYDLVLIDTPPGGAPAIDMALGAARYLVIPSPPDHSSIKGLAFVARSVERARLVNPDLMMLGTVLVEVPTNASRIRADALKVLEQTLGDPSLLFRTSLRSALKPAIQGRREGLLAFELAEKLDGGRPFWDYLKAGETVPDRAASAPGLAADYVAITDELLSRIHQQEQLEENDG